MVRTLKTPAKSRAQANIIQFLVKADDDPNARDADGATPLHRAVRTRCADAASALLVNGADARTRNNSGSTALHLAVQNTGRGGTGAPVTQDQQRQIRGLLLDHGAQISDQDAKGQSVANCLKSAWIREILERARRANR